MGETVFSLKLSADEYERFDPRVTEGLVGSITKVNYGGEIYDAKIVDAQVVDDGKFIELTLEL